MTAVPPTPHTRTGSASLVLNAGGFSVTNVRRRLGPFHQISTNLENGGLLGFQHEDEGRVY
ncbi:hypothetical protein SBA2_10138 [Acidobacteriia bacterium SbA2]|nr:hypothetical protein SBA2_10138 [Acidobacteriia bacterium SbA2]